MLTKITRLKYLLPVTLCVFLGILSTKAQIVTRTTESGDTLSRSEKFPAYRWKDSYLNSFSYDLSNSPFLKLDVDSLQTKIFFQPQNENINVEEKIGRDTYYKLPQAMSFNEYSSLQNAAVRKSILRDYERMQDGNSTASGRGLKPLLKKNPIVDRIFGGKAPEFKPNGFISADLRVGTQFDNNPIIPLQQRRRPVFDFDQQISVNFNSLFNNSGGNDDFNGNTGNPNQGNSTQDIAKLGKTLGGLMGAGQQAREKVNILGNIDTKSAFSFENQFKLNFKNEPEDILQSIELGNISFPLQSQLIPGVDKLMGLKAGLRFGKLDITTVLAQQTSRTESILISGGNQNRPFELRVDNYDENKHFFLSHFFRDQYEKSLKNLPMVTSQAYITRVEVYVTNRTKTVGSMRNLVGFADLGEVNPNNPAVTITSTSDKVASNQANSLGDIVLNNEDFRKIDNTNIALEQNGLDKGIDFEILRGAKKLTEREFMFNPQLGYISLLTPLRNDEILAVSYEYTYGGKAYKVGELTEDYSIRPEDEVVALKLLKSSTIRNRLDNPMWDLMMKNVYSLAQGQIQREGFQLRIIYKDDVTGMDSPNLPESQDSLNKTPLIEILGLDQLNYNNDREKDGNFDYIENVTINEQQGTIIFPQLEPFGSYLNEVLPEDLRLKYVFQELYDKTLTDAQQVNTKNKFFINGSVQSSSKDIPLPLGASGGAVRVYSGGTQLQEGVDYQVDTQIGRIRLINPSILASGRSIRIDYERPDLFQTQIRRMFGLRFDYTVSPAFRIGATYMDLKENTPGFLTRTAIGSEPVNNTLWGLDVNFKKEGNGFTRLLDKLPLIQTKEPSSIILSAEFAQLIPGVNNKRVNNNAMIDDFEAARTINDLTRQPQRWRLGSTPNEAKYRDPSSPIYGYNFKRAKISAYSVDASTYFSAGFGASIVPKEITDSASNNLFERPFQIQDIFPGRSRPVLGQNLPTSILDISFFPQERGMYNYNPNLTSNGFLPDPKNNFGAVMRGITFDADFDNSNIEYLEFWMLNPFPPAGTSTTSDLYTVRDGVVNKANTTGGKLIFHLGDISEDVIPDNRFNFENGIPPYDSTGRQADSTSWGNAPRTQFVTDAFDNAENARERQDVGLDGLSNSRESEFPHIRNFLDAVNVTDAEARRQLEEDPSADDFKFFLDDSFDSNDFLVKRYKNYLGMEKNSPPINDTQNLTPASTVQADKEDINEDNTINDVESYHEYSVDLKPGDLNIGNGYIIDKVVSGSAEWFLFRIPLRQEGGDTTKYNKVGGISGFKSIRFMRMVMTEWEQPVVLRFAALQLVANQYRTYTQDLNNTSLVDKDESTGTDFRVTTVSVEENGCTEDGDCNVKPGQTPYVVPPGFIRDRDLTQQIFRQYNEQSVSLSVDNLKDGEKRGIFKNTDLDLNMYKRIKMFVHMQKENESAVGGGAFIRFGTDLRTNYYEIEIPQLKATPNGSDDDPEIIWPEENEFDFPLDLLRSLKVERNKNLGRTAESTSVPYDTLITVPGTNYLEQVVNRQYRLSVVGNPDFSNTRVWMVGVSNPKETTETGPAANFTIWANELRANGFDQTKGEAGVMAADIKIADLGTVSISGNMSTYGFGGVQSGISARSRENIQGFGIASTLELDKLMPEQWGWSIPLFMNFDQQVITPHFDPLDPDIVLERSLERFATQAERDDYRNKIIDRTTNKGFNLANVRKIQTDPSAKAHLYDIENFSFSYAKNSLSRSNILIDEYRSEQEKGALTYEFSPKQVLWEPFKKGTKLEKPSLKWIKDFNFSPIPNLIAFRTDFDRTFIKTQYRNADLGTAGIDPNYIKFFNTNRFYDVQWDFTKSITFNYSAQMRSLIDEPYGEPDREAIWNNLKTFGRANYFKQSIEGSYALPLDKFFLLDWIEADARFNADYVFRANAWDLLQKRSIPDENGTPFGNFIENNREYGVRGRVDLVKLYNKLKYLRFANSPDAPKERFTRAPGVEDEVSLPTSDLLKKFTRLLMTVRGVNFNFVRTEGTILPGFLETPNLFGLARGNQAPGLGFAMFGKQNFGKQNIDLQKLANQNLLSESVVRNDPFTQSRQTKFDFGTNLEPWAGFRMQIRGNYARGDSYQSIFKPNSNGNFEQSNPFRNGTFSMSFWSFKTVFKKMENNPETNYKYEVFENMKSNREEVIRRIYASRNKIDYNSIAETPLNELQSNLSPNSQDVLIPAFFAAYTGGSVDKLFGKVNKRGQDTFNPFLQFPMPNWRIDYSGLEKLPVFSKLFSSLTFSHSYTSTYSVGNFTSSLNYGAAFVDLNQNGYLLGDQVNPSVGFFLPVFVMSSITMEERYSPLIGVQFTTKNKISGSFKFNKERRASLNLANTQVAEYNSDDFVFGFGFKKPNIKLPFRGKDGNMVVLKNDVNFRFDLTIRDIKLLQRRLDEQYANNANDNLFGEVVPIQGNYNFQLRPQVQYQFNKKLSMSFYIEHFKNLPFTSITFARSHTIGGINMRFNLAD